MLSSAVKRFILPFVPQKNVGRFSPETEGAAVYALAELERVKGGGLILKQPEEKLVFLAKLGYPLWLFPKNEITYIFDGLNDSAYTFSYFELPSAKAFMDSLDTDSKTREEFAAFLSDHDNYFSHSKKEKTLSLCNVIIDEDFKKEFNSYRKESAEVTSQIANLGLLPPILEEARISSMLTEIGNLQAVIKDDSDRLMECLRLVNRITSQYVTELDYAAEAVRDEANAKIKAQEEVINPKITALNSQYKRRIADVARNFDQEIENLEKLKTRTEKYMENNEAKIRIYQREAETQASKNHLIYEKHWKEKTAQTKKELNGLKKELKRTEKSIKNITKQKKSQIAQLQAELDAEVKHARQPLLDLETARDAKMLVFKRETEKLLRLEKPVVDGLNGTVKLGEAVNAKFGMLGMKDPQLKSPALFYVPFYVACYQSGLSKRFIFLPPSMPSDSGFAAKFKGALGMSKIKDLLIPRFKSISTLTDRVQVLAKQDSLLDSQIRSLAEKNNLLTTRLARDNISEGLLYLRSQGWLSDKDYQSVSDSLAYF
jgi:CRISPR/Cas system-associated endoribonuclease Cas2